MVDSIVKAVCPTMPSDYKVQSVKDSVKWYRIMVSTKTLFVPPFNIIKTNPVQLDKTVEAIIAFSKWNESDTKYDWNNLHLEEFRNGEIIKGLKRVEELISGPYVAVDIETKSLSWKDNRLLSIGIAVNENTCVALYNIPIKGSITGDMLKMDVNDTYEALQDFFNRKDLKFIWHNGKFDCGKLKYLCNIDARVDEDTMLQHYARINEKKGTHGLKELGQLYLQSPAWDDELDKIKKDYCKKNKVLLKDFTYDLIPIEVLIPYMQRDCIATMRLFHLFNSLAKPSTEFIYRKLIEASEAYMSMELAGVALDMDYLEDLEWDLEKKLKEANTKMNKAVGYYWNPAEYSKDTGAKVSLNEPFNMKSPKQLKWILEKALGYPLPNTDKDTIQQIQRDIELGNIKDEKAVEFIEGILVLRKYNKQMDTYVQGLRDVVCSDYRVRGTFNLHGTETGRLSSNNPNMQNIPRDKSIKNLLRVPQGYRMVQLDYSQAELRVLAYMSQDPFMIKAYQDGKDFHNAIAEDMFGPDYTKEQRNMAKTINFGIAYGRGPSSISESFGKSMSESKAIIEKWYAPMPKVKQYIDNRRRMPLRGEPCVTVFGRERHFVITDEELYHIQNEYINTPIQSTASDLTMFSLIEIYKWLKESNLDARIITTVHDSIILEVKDNQETVVKVAKKCQQIMAEVPKSLLPNCTVPFRADIETGYTWGNLKELEE